MQMIPLGRTDIQVSDWCLGTMTYGNQTPQDDAHRQIDMALAAGILVGLDGEGSRAWLAMGSRNCSRFWAATKRPPAKS